MMSNNIISIFGIRSYVFNYHRVSLRREKDKLANLRLINRHYADNIEKEHKAQNKHY